MLADIFNRLGYMERQGSGLGKIMDAYTNAHNFAPGMEPAFFSSRSQFTVTFRNLNIGVNSANPDANVGANKVAAELSILSVLKDNPKVSQVSISEFTNIPRRTLQRIMKKMVDAGKIERIGGTRGYWKINE